MKNTKSDRLSSHITPIKYQITLRPNLEKFVFEGSETIHLSILKATNSITLHSKELTIWNAEFRITNNEYKAKQIKYDKKNETATFVFSKVLPKGKGELNLKFSGSLNDKMRGFYRSRYMHEGKEKHLATTQFEATDARRCVPCFDEPDRKAVFEVSLIVPKGKTAISNTIPISVKEHEAGYEILEFQPTPKMSTYLLAFIVGDLEFLEAKTKTGVKVRVFTTHGKKHQAKFALSCAVKALEYYENYFAIKYPLPVLDMIAIPDFASAAMENWGAITYRETALLVDEENSTASTKQWVAIVVAHEIAHMWFGNLVTMQWWTHLWLNEGFASYMEYKCVDHMFPKWQMWDQYVSGRFASALRLDSLSTTHPIEVEVRHPSEISEIFDEVSYAKGSSVIRMLANFLGEKDFRDGLRLYLKKHAFKNTKTEDLWQALEKVSKKPVRKIMKEWTGQPGYPVVRVIEEQKKLLLTQSRFFSSRISRKQNKKNAVWQIPLEYNGKKSLMSGKRMVLPKPPKAKKLNLGETSFVRVDYPAQMLAEFKPQILQKKLSAVDRLALVRDCFALAESGQLPTTVALEFIQSYKNEDNLVVWEEICTNLARLSSLLYGTAGFELLKNYSQNLLLPISKKLTWKESEGESQNTKLLRSLILSSLGFAGHKETILLVKTILNSKNKIHANIRSVVYNINSRFGNAKTHKYFVEKYLKEEMHEEQERFGRALTHFADTKLLLKTLKFCMTKNVRSQDAPFIMAGVWANPYGRNLAWEFFKRNFPELKKRYDDGLGLVARILKVAGVFTDTEHAKDIQKYFKKHPVKSAERTIKQALEKIYSNAEWLKADGEKIVKWLVQNLKHE